MQRKEIIDVAIALATSVLDSTVKLKKAVVAVCDFIACPNCMMKQDSRSRQALWALGFRSLGSPWYVASYQSLFIRSGKTNVSSVVV